MDCIVDYATNISQKHPADASDADWANNIPGAVSIIAVLKNIDMRFVPNAASYSIVQSFREEKSWIGYRLPIIYIK